MSDALSESWSNVMAKANRAHISRSWPGAGAPLEAECPCPKEPCGYVARDRVVPECPQHRGSKTIRDSHEARDCPGHA